MAALRGEGMMTRRERLAKIKKGPGVFVYDGKAVVHERVPTVKKHGRNIPVLDSEGMPVIDQSGRQVYEKSGTIVRDIMGRPILGGTPDIKEVPIKVRELWGVRFPPGEPVKVSDPALALKLRCMPHFSEAEKDETPISEPVIVIEEQPKRKPGRPPKAA